VSIQQRCEIARQSHRALKPGGGVMSAQKDLNGYTDISAVSTRNATTPRGRSERPRKATFPLSRGTLLRNADS
jgi:hypothetical protein